MENDVSRLPKWAQQRISRLEADLLHAKERLAVGPENSNTFANPFSENAVTPLGFGTRIRFTTEAGRLKYFDVRLRGQTLEITGDEILTISPRSSNSIYINHEKE